MITGRTGQQVLKCVSSSACATTSKAGFKSPSIPKQLQKELDRRSKRTFQERLEPYKENPAFYRTANSPVLYERFESRLKRRLWAAEGASSGIDPADLFPSEETVKEMEVAEKEWWPSLHEMQSNIQAKKDAVDAIVKRKQAIIAENMKKMPQWIDEYHKNQAKLKEDQQNEIHQKLVEIQQAQEKFGYEISSNHEQLKQYLSDKKALSRKTKKAAQRAKRKQVQAY